MNYNNDSWGKPVYERGKIGFNFPFTIVLLYRLEQKARIYLTNFSEICLSCRKFNNSGVVPPLNALFLIKVISNNTFSSYHAK